MNQATLGDRVVIFVTPDVSSNNEITGRIVSMQGGPVILLDPKYQNYDGWGFEARKKDIEYYKIPIQYTGLRCGVISHNGVHPDGVADCIMRVLHSTSQRRIK